MNYVEFHDEEESFSNSLQDRLLQSNTEISDTDLKKIYKYHFYRGYHNIILLELVNLCSTLFMVFFILILVKCIDYEGLGAITKGDDNYLWDYIELRNIIEPTFLNICFIIIFSLYILLRLITLIDDIKGYSEIKDFIKRKLDLGTYDIKNMEWLEIVNRLEDTFGIGIYQVQSRILRTENIMITIFDSGLNKFVFSKLMEWNITYGIFNTVQKYFNLDDIIIKNYLEESEFLEDNNEKVEKQKLKFKNKEKIIKECSRNFIILAFITFLFMPFLFIYVLFFSFLKYGERYYHNPVKITYRQWSINSYWKMRYYNELTSDLDVRTDISSKYAKEYLNSHKSKIIQNIIKFLVLITSSLFMILLFLSVYNENLLLNLNITPHRHILWYLGILASIIAIGRSVIKNNTTRLNKIEKADSLKKLLIYNPFLRNINGSNKQEIEQNRVSEIKKTYIYQLHTLFKECFSVLIVPCCLIYICNYMYSIINTLENNLYYDEVLGFIAKDSHFRILRKDSNNKSLLSFKEFRRKYPDWGANIEIYQLDNISILQKNSDEDKPNHNYPKSIFDNTFNSDISII